MNKSQLYRHLNVQVDLAVEAHQMLRGESGEEIPGVIMDEQKLDHAKVTIITVETDEGVEAIGKPKGQYITIDAPEIRNNDYSVHEAITQILADRLIDLMDLSEDASILIIGLGNWNATPDALGPQVIDKTMVTRHLYQLSPEELKGKMRKVSAISPGVLGTTGIETAEIIRGIVDHVKPDLVIAIDALAAGSPERIGTSIQLADTGIHPGSGVGNPRAGINEETIGCKVIAIGLPTVLNAAIIAHDAVEGIFKEFVTSPSLYKLYKGIKPEVYSKIIDDVLSPFQGNLMVTPKEIDSLIQISAKIIAGALTISLHPGIDREDYERYLQ
ncbi:GPR endopeptidase [Desulfosporosinus acidiphilus SJ4]|uniref:Germination protease n=1 Tax=Desulfosporosinus acidiphilus (strain DSM 22704 / JCM 16185 / SJ4) TaxID=646529 RepID=I4D9S4_DESAJ|nr:GPR endopeptidase [Desulfosporosinus acidiphilus]AFM42548.1 GPR endopeptidase [Desulfosporosinus acidiphilus SJ4]